MSPGIMDLFQLELKRQVMGISKAFFRTILTLLQSAPCFLSSGSLFVRNGYIQITGRLSTVLAVHNRNLIIGLNPVGLIKFLLCANLS